MGNKGIEAHSHIFEVYCMSAVEDREYTPFSR